MNLGLKKGGEVQFVLSIPVANLVEARDSWARTTGHFDPNWDSKKGTYAGFPVVKTRKPALSRKVLKPNFYY